MKKNLWLKWTFNCAFGELLGIGIAGAIAFAVNYFFGEPESLSSKLVVLFFMMIAGAIEGSLLGFFQWKVLVQKFANIPKREWLSYTIAVAVLGWFLGMLPSLFFMPSMVESETTSTLDFSNPFLFALLSISSGLVLGAIFGLFQWFSLKKYVYKADQWIWTNAIGWGIGLGWIYLFASIPTESTSLGFNILMGICGGVLAGLSVGAITGISVLNLKKRVN